MTPLTLKYPEDWTGHLASNAIVGEEHSVPRLKNKCYALDGGPFFTESLVITEKLTGKVLVRDVDYQPIFLYQDATLYAGKEICAAIAIINDDVTGTLVNDYQIIGGTYVSLVDALYQAIEALQLDERPINWDDLKNKPELYPPEPHIHHVSAIYGTEHLCAAIYSLKAAILIGDAASDNRLWDALAKLREDMQTADSALEDLLYGHANRLDNPHQVTKEQVGLGNIFNYPVANQIEAEAAVAPDRYMTAQAVGWAINKIAGGLVDAHANRKDNPHSVTKAQVNLGSVENYGIATDPEAQQGTVRNKYMTPYAVALAINALAMPTINNHIANKNNPHAVTKTQVGLGNVQDYPVASQQEAQAGVATNRYMTPQTVAWAINTLAAALVNAHANRKDNPHSVTATQVGLGSVRNMGTASDSEAIADNNNVYSTPHSARLAASRIVDERLFTGTYSGNRIAYVDAGGGTRLGETIIIMGGGAERTRIRWAASAGGGSAVYFNSNIDVANCYVRSDIRSKQNVRYLHETPSETFSPRLRAAAQHLARYQYKHDPNYEKIGIIAQGLAESLPELVMENADGLLTLDLPGYSAVLLAGWNEHDREISALKDMVNELLHEVKRLRG